MPATQNRSSLWYNLYGSVSFFLSPFCKIRLKFWFSVSIGLTLVWKLATSQTLNQRSSLSFFQECAHLYLDSLAGRDSWRQPLIGSRSASIGGFSKIVSSKKRKHCSKLHRWQTTDIPVQMRFLSEIASWRWGIEMYAILMEITGNSCP